MKYSLRSSEILSSQSFLTRHTHQNHGVLFGRQANAAASYRILKGGSNGDSVLERAIIITYILYTIRV
jgi:hypothetical protein